jgi:hypothetical protein
MWIKIAIVTLFAALVVSLFSGLYYLMKDQGTTRRTLNSLGLRITLAAAMMALIGYGFYTGELRSKAPWDAKLRQQPSQDQSLLDGQ